MKIQYIFFTVILSVLNVFANAQTGIGTRNPHESAALELSTTNQGLLLPTVTFTSAIGLANSTTPVSSPKTGSLVYNTGGNFKKGVYYWDGSQWQKLMTNEEVDQNLNLQINEYVAGASITGSTVVNSGATGNDVSLTNAVISSSFTPGSYSKTASALTLPPGRYKLDIALDCNSPNSPDPTTLTSPNSYFNSKTHIFSLLAEIRNATTNVPLTGTSAKVSTKVAEFGGSSLQNHKFQFVFELTAATPVKFFFQNENGSSDFTAKVYRKYGLVANFYKLKTP